MLAISIHALREESDDEVYRYFCTLEISIHALREESDQAILDHRMRGFVFQSTLSVRRATRNGNGFH